MNTITSILLIGLCLTGALASPVAPKEAQEGEARTIYNSGGGIYLGLNSTILWVAVAGLLVGAILIYAGASSGLLDDTQSYGYQQRYDQYHQPQEQPYRTKRSYDENMVTKMLQLEQIFKKYEVEEDECKAYIACEAANVERLAENGPIVQKAHELFSAITKPEHLTKLKANKGMMIMKQAFDSAKTRQHEVDVCAPLRNACSALRQKTN
jgi:hypothetical protein